MASSGNFCTWNAVMAASNFTGTLSIGNTKSQPTSDCTGFGTMAMTTGKKWYFEARAGAMSGGSSMIGIMKLSDTHSISNYNTYQHSNTNLADAYYVASGDRILNGSGSTVGGSYSENDVIGVAVDLESSTNTITFYKNNSGQGSLNLTGTGIDYVPSLIRVPNAGGFIGNWGQDSTFGGAVTAGGNADANGFGDFLYSVPSGHLAICSANLGISDDIDPAQTDDDYPGKNFNVVLFDGNGSTNAVTGLGFQPDFIWGFTRSGSQSKRMIDSSRGGASRLYSDLYGAADTSNTAISAFGTDGFTANGGYFNNDNGKTCGAWCWKMNGGTTATNNDGNVTTTVQANSAAGQSIVQWTGTGTNSRTLGTGLSKKAEFVMVKDISTGTYYWVLYHHNANAGNLPGDYGVVYLNANNAYSSGSGSLTFWDVSAFTDTVFSVGGSGGTNTSGNSMLAYCFHSVDGYSRFSYYNGNGNADGPFVYTGFRPRMIFLKRTDSTGNWHIFDTARNTENAVDTYQLWNTSGTDDTASSNSIDFLSNGFKIRNSAAQLNTDGADYIYGAWGDVPFKYNNTF